MNTLPLNPSMSNIPSAHLCPLCLRPHEDAPQQTKEPTVTQSNDQPPESAKEPEKPLSANETQTVQFWLDDIRAEIDP